MPGRIGLVDDDADTLRAVRRQLERSGFKVFPFSSGGELLAEMERVPSLVDVVVTDVHMPGMDGLMLLGRLREGWPNLPVLIMTAGGTVREAVEAMRRGADDYLIKPFESIEEVIARLSKAVEHKRLLDRNRFLETRLAVADRFEGMVGNTPGMRDVFRLIETVAPTDATVLILGESGTGKEMVAHAIHDRSRRRDRPMLPVNCSALAETLLESELFGHVKGAFTGATSARRGVFEEADGGTIFLDEIGDMSLAMQVRLLRTLQDGEVRPVGSNEPKHVDVRVLAATNVDLLEAVQAGRFRQDLYFRLNVITVTVPSLRERPEDIPRLVQHFLPLHAERHGKAEPVMDAAVMDRLAKYDWPGNVRELENTLLRLVVLSRAGAISTDLLPQAMRQAPSEAPPYATQLAREQPLPQARRLVLDSFERRYLEEALQRAEGSLSEAARRSGVDRTNFRRLVRRHGLDAGAFARRSQRPLS